MLDELLTVSTGGGVVGILGHAVTSIVGIFEAREQRIAEQERFEFELKRQANELRAEEMNRQFDIELAKHEAAAAAQRDEMLLERESRTLDAANLAASYSHDRPDYSSLPDSKLLIFGEFIRTTTRPSVTYLLMLFTGLFFIFGSTEIKTLIATSVVGLTGTAIGWWFADRTKRVASNMLAQRKSA